LLLDVTGCAHLFGGEEAMARQIARDFQRGGLSPRVGIADTVGAAWALARYGSEAVGLDLSADRFRPLVVAAGRVAEALGPLPVEGLRLSPGIVEILRDLGIETIGQLIALPRETLPSRFGAEIVRRLDQALGHVPEPIACQRPFEPAEASWGCEPPIEGRSAVEAVLRRLFLRVLRRLRSRNEGILQFDVDLCVSEKRSTRFSVGLVRPTLNEKRLLELARLQLERVRLRGKVSSVKVCVSRRAPLDVEQSALFAAAGRPNAQRDLESLLNRLSNRLGEEAVLSAKLYPDFQPERSVEYQPVTKGGDAHPLIKGDQDRPLEKRGKWSRRTRAESPLLGSPRQRPLRLLPQPQAAQVWSVVPDGPPIRLIWRDGEHQILRCEGPERIETGWWRPGPCLRDYFRAEMDNGRRLWLFHAHDEGAWFVHGEF
jgi:protein ImuB